MVIWKEKIEEIKTCPLIEVKLVTKERKKFVVTVDQYTLFDWELSLVSGGEMIMKEGVKCWVTVVAYVWIATAITMVILPVQTNSQHRTFINDNATDLDGFCFFNGGEEEPVEECEPTEQQQAIAIQTSINDCQEENI